MDKGVLRIIMKNQPCQAQTVQHDYLPSSHFPSPSTAGSGCIKPTHCAGLASNGRTRCWSVKVTWAQSFKLLEFRRVQAGFHQRSRLGPPIFEVLRTKADQGPGKHRGDHDDLD